MRFLTEVLAALLTIVLIPSLDAADPPVQTENPLISRQEILNLIAQLGDAKYKQRQEAVSRLKNLREARPFLEIALQSEDAEVAKLAAQILKKLPGKLDVGKLQALRRYLHSGRIDIALSEYSTLETASDDKAYWQFGMEIAEKIYSEARKSHANDTDDPKANSFDWLKKDLPNQCKDFRVSSQVNDGVRDSGCFRGEKISFYSHHSRCLFVGSETVYISHPEESIILSSGPSHTGRILQSLVVCDGDATLSTVHNSIIIARGNVVDIHKIHNSIVLYSGNLPATKDLDIESKSYIGAGVKNPLGFIKWFDPEEIGISVQRAADVVSIKKLDPKKGFAKAGCEVGDAIKMVDGKAIGKLEEFRRALIRRVREGTTKLTILRVGQKVDLTVQFSLDD